uniref:S10_plectin domain-containing protein n=1 Tax=Rhabditophanes sp. KR3021 TaxID=114890 RepID=A0AC35TFM0_9BILA
MLMPKADRKKIYEQLFEEGVLIAAKDFTQTIHPEIKVRNLYVVKSLKGLVSQGYVKEQFAWRHYYFYLTNEGVVYLRDYLGLEQGVVPSTHKVREATATFADRSGARGAGQKREYNDRQSYRTQQDKITEVGPGNAPVNAVNPRAGFGRRQQAPAAEKQEE